MEIDTFSRKKSWTEAAGGALSSPIFFGNDPSSDSSGARNRTKYYYDAFGRRAEKVTPDLYDTQFFYSTDDDLLARYYSQGQDEEYVWLDGSLVATLRSEFNGESHFSDKPDSNCYAFPDDPESLPCGIHFVVSDPARKPLLTIDANGQLSGVFDYDPFGYVNRVNTPVATAHPYSNSQTNVLLGSFVQPPETGIVVDMRVHFDDIDTETQDGACVDSVDLIDSNTTGTFLGGICSIWSPTFWTQWWTTSAGSTDMVFTSNATNCCPGHSSISPESPSKCSTAGCSSYPDFGYNGVVAGQYEYRRYEDGAVPYSVPMRFAGHFYDSDTDLFQNWNRFYDPVIGRYLQPDPILSTATRSSDLDLKNPYAYVGSNPTGRLDPNGYAPIPLPHNIPTPDVSALLAACRDCGANPITFGVSAVGTFPMVGSYSCDSPRCPGVTLKGTLDMSQRDVTRDMKFLSDCLDNAPTYDVTFRKIGP